MKIGYVTPYVGEEQALKLALNDQEIIFINEALDEKNLEQVKDVDILSVFVDSEVRKDVIDSLPNLKYITTRSTGYDHVDFAYAISKNIPVSNVPKYGSRTVAEYAFALMLAISRKAHAAYDRLKLEGETDVKDFEGFDLNGKTLGIIGTGAIGKNVARIAKGFAMNIHAHDPYPSQELAEETGLKYMSLEEVMQTADLITIHVPYMKETHHLIGDKELALCKNTAFIINTARGEIIDTIALLKALEEKKVAGAALDVLEGEREIKDEVDLLTDKVNDINKFQMLLADHVLMKMENVIITPHIAFNSIEAKREITGTTIENIKNFIAGNIINSVKI